jgi:hypothetical protein
MTARSAAVSCLALAAAALIASPVASRAEGLPKTLSCKFEKGSSIAYADGKYDATPAQPLNFAIADINLDGQLAVLETGGGKAALRIVRAVNANHFLEVVNEGFLNLTTVYDEDKERKAFPAVHSRHVGLLGEPVVAQYYGFCTAK